MDKACSKIETVVRAQEPDMLRSLLNASFKVIGSKCVGLTQRFLSQVLEIYPTPFHPLHITFKHLSQLENHGLVEVALRV